MCLITSLFSTCVLAQNLSTESQSIEKDSVSIENEVVVKKNKINDVSIIKKEKQEKLKELGFDIDKVEYIEDIKSNEDKTTYKKLVKDENE